METMMVSINPRPRQLKAAEAPRGMTADVRDGHIALLSGQSLLSPSLFLIDNEQLTPAAEKNSCKFSRFM